LKKKSTEQKCVKLLFVYYFFTGIWQIEWWPVPARRLRLQHSSQLWSGRKAY
jgi:hypothetical protein